MEPHEQPAGGGWRVTALGAKAMFRKLPLDGAGIHAGTDAGVTRQCRAEAASGNAGHNRVAGGKLE